MFPHLILTGREFQIFGPREARLFVSNLVEVSITKPAAATLMCQVPSLDIALRL